MKAKRLLAIFAAFTMSAALFAVGCGDGDNDDDKKGPGTEQDGDNKDPNNPGGGDNTDPNNPGGENPGGENPGGETPTEFTGKIYLVGDSTVCSFNDNYYMPRYGYGTQLYNYLNCNEDQIVNLALSGRSSLSFLTENNYKTLKESITTGDYLIIGFGHNDEKNEADRFTNPNKTYEDTTQEGGPSFQYTLYQNYVKLAVDNGATPILCTPIVRYNADTSKYEGSNGHITADGNYPQAIKTLGEATNTTVIDLTAITKADYIEKGEEALLYHAHTSYNEVDGVKVPSGEDPTHLNYYGAKMVAYELAEAIKASDNSLKNHVNTNNVKPTKEADYKAGIKTDFVKPDYTQFDPTAYENQYLGTVSNQSWYSTIMGSVGGTERFGEYKVELSGDKITVGNTAASGKFASTEYGFAAAFIQIPSNKNFTASATGTVIAKESGANNQTGFGMMIRDDIYINTSDSNIKSNCLMAGAVLTKGAIFKYTESKMTNPSKAKTDFALDAVVPGTTYSMSITKTDNSFTVTFTVNGTTYTETCPDFDVYAVDADYMYLCLFANRGITLEYSDISVAITGESQGA